ncbi:hypothetical protein CF326_g8660 [Tilletia indica]|nr:hypothetical protein CF326_g8660 [Tilletia indica]
MAASPDNSRTASAGIARQHDLVSPAPPAPIPASPAPATSAATSGATVTRSSKRSAVAKDKRSGVKSKASPTQEKKTVLVWHTT